MEMGMNLIVHLRISWPSQCDAGDIDALKVAIGDREPQDGLKPIHI